MTKKLLFLAIILHSLCYSAFSQSIYGKVTDAQSGEILVMANILGPDRRGTVTTIEGNFRLDIPAGEIKITVSYVGYEAKDLTITIAEGENKELNIQLKPINEVLETVVITAGKFEQRIEQTTISLDVIKPNLIEEKNTVSLQDAFNQTPGVIISDDQANIRSGSGWSFGAGSRVLMMVDDMPMMSPDAGQVQWKLLPNEAVLQMEVIKGAASALFGTSAMNGLINVRTITPKSEPITKVMLFGGMYDTPKRKELKWWDGIQMQGGFSFVHSTKIKTADFTISGLVLRDPGFRKYEIDNRNRINIKTQFYPAKIKGLTYGINGCLLYAETGDALLWQDYDNAYLPREDDATRGDNWNYYVDPFIIYRHGRGKHTLKGRVLGINNDIASNSQDYKNFSTYFYTEYQYQHFLTNNLWVTTGLVGALGYSDSEVFTGYHETKNGAVFLQVDKKFERLSVTGGIRYEAYKLDKTNYGKPVIRAGVNYQAAQATFIRASYGGGYRFPSMAETFTYTRVGNTGVFPNHDLLPESGWSAEVGVKQGVKFSDSWKGFFDAAFFINRFDNMTEFTFSNWTVNDSSLLGFKSVNVGPTQITGVEISISGAGEIGPLKIRLFGGYAYTNPIALEPDRVYADNSSGTGITYNLTSSDPTNNILKYRYKHLVRFDSQVDYKKVGIGLSIRYNDFMQNIDKVFDFNLPAPGVHESREILNSGDLIFDARLIYHISEHWRLSLIVDNLTNREFLPRPAQLGPPRKYTLQILFSI